MDVTKNICMLTVSISLLSQHLAKHLDFAVFLDKAHWSHSYMVSRYLPIQVALFCFQEPIIKKFLKSHDVGKTLEAIEAATTVPKETLCTLLLTRTLEKSGKINFLC